MSLLLEALKKAEKAKSAELPDIKQPLEILSDEIAPKEVPASLPQTSGMGDPPKRNEAPIAATGSLELQFKEPNPRLPFYLTLGLLGVLALGAGGHFWYQLRPHPPLVNTDPPGGSAAPAQVAAPQMAAPTEPDVQAPIPGLPAAEAVTPSEKASVPTPPAPKPRSKARSRIVKPAAPILASVAAPSLPEQPASIVSTNRPRPRVHPKVETAYAAYLKGDLPSALSDYQAALREDSGNRDALLGLAAIEMRSGRLETAEATYLRLLHLDPGNAHAQAGLIALRSSQLDPLATESRVKSMLAARPEDVLHFTLGNQLAQQGRWAEAQQEYFKAHAAAPDNPDFAYNLAVSLDHMRQHGPALEYYRRALALAGERTASFDTGAARMRAAQLEK